MAQTLTKLRALALVAVTVPWCLSVSTIGDVWAQGSHGDDDEHLIEIARQGSFMVGGSVITNPGTFDPNNPTPEGQTLHGDHAYVQFQIPPNRRDLPLVMWHGAGQSSKTWESTPDGREGYQTIFLRRGFAVYILDQPRRGRSGRSTEGATITPTPDEQGNFQAARLGIWPNFFPGVQFSSDPDALDQLFRQATPNTGPGFQPTGEIVTDAVAALFDKIGPAVLLTHSAGGRWGWLTAMKSENVKAIVSYETGAFVFPEGEVPPPIVTPTGTTAGQAVSPEDFEKLTRIPIELVYGDNIPTETSPNPGLDIHYRGFAMAALFVDAVNRHGGDASILHLPDVGVFGNTHFAFADLNNIQVADLVSSYLHEKGLDRRRH
jgi:pimeloyl-ACP methyl ester carboxylesterase